MPRKKRSLSPYKAFCDNFDDDTNSQNGSPPIQRNAANARERARMRVLASAFGRLKTKLPNIPPDTKLSKLDTLRLATMYIKQLKAVVEGASKEDHFKIVQDEDFNIQSCSQNMTWPFGHHQIVNNNNNKQMLCQYTNINWNCSQIPPCPKISRLCNESFNSHSNYWYDCDSNRSTIFNPTETSNRIQKT